LFLQKLRFVLSVVASILFLLLLPLMIFCLFRLVFLFRFHSLRVSQSGNNISVAVTCHLVACILHNPNLTELVLDHQPFVCEGHDAWRSEGLHDVNVLSLEDAEWTAVLRSLREVSMQIIFRRPAQSGLLFFFVLFVLHLPLALPGRSQQIRAPDFCLARWHTGLQCAVGPSAFVICYLTCCRQACR
jgi:hypothetical protein